MIVSFRHKGLKGLYEHGTVRGVQPQHAAKLQRILAALDAARTPHDLNLPAFRLHRLRGWRQRTWSIAVSGTWRITFRFVGEDVADVDYEDYH